MGNLASTGVGKRRISSPRAVLAVAVLGTFMAFVDATIVNIAVPNIAHDFSGSRLSSVSWVLNAYNIVFAAFLVGGGQLADLLGRRRVFSAALILFTLASALCAVSPSLSFLIGARLFQAAGAAMLVPSSLAIVLEAHESQERMHAVALWSAVAALAAGIGPPLGGLLITASNWRLVFLVNVPVGLVAFVLAQRVLVESRAPGRRRMPDLLGGGVLALAIASLVLGVVKGQEWGWGGGRVIGAFLLAILLGVYFTLRSARHRAPVLDLSLLRIRAFALSNGVTVVMASGFYAYTLCNVLFLTSVWRYSILTAGLALTPGPFTAMAVAGPASRLVERIGHRAVVVPGALIWACGMVYFAERLGVKADFLGSWLPGMLILGIGAGMSFPTLSGAAVGSVPGPRFAVATSLNSVARQLGAAIGVAILIAIVGNPSPLQALHAFEHGWWFAGACFALGALVCLGLVVRGPEEIAAAGAGAGGLGMDPPGASTPEEIARVALPSLLDADGARALSEPQTVAEFLRNVPLFADISPEMREEIANIAQSLRLERGSWLFRQDEEADGVYVVRLGHLEVIQEGEEPETINTLTRGAVLGELALLSESTRSASVRALRDSELLKIDKDAFQALLRSEPELALSLTRVLSTQLQASRALPVARRAQPVTIALCAASPGVDMLAFAHELSQEMCAWGRVAVLYPEDSPGRLKESREQALARYAPLIESCESAHDQVLMLAPADATSSLWDEFCRSRADRVLAVVNPDAPPPSTAEQGLLRGADLLALDVTPGSGSLGSWVEAILPTSVFTVSSSAPRADIARTARRLCGRSVGVVLSGGGARAFAHLGVLEVLLDAGLLVDRVGGVSMGSFIGGLLACGHESAAMDAYCYEEWVRRNPINDYTIPRSSLVKGHKAEAMLERVFGELQLEELSRPYYCASVDLRGNRLRVDTHGSMILAIGASISLPLIAPPMRREESLLIDGSLLDNLPLEPMSASGEGPVLAVDIKGGEERTHPRTGAVDTDAAAVPVASTHNRRLPSLPETMARIALLSSASTDESARRHADTTIRVRVSGVGLLEFHQIDEARAAGRLAAQAALEQGAPGWLSGPRASSGDLSGRRTVIRV